MTKPPQSWRQTDAATLKAVEEWIATVHPACEAELKKICARGRAYDHHTTLCRLLWHLVRDHDASVLLVAQAAERIYFTKEDDSPILDTFGAKHDRYFNEIKNKWDELAAMKGGPAVVNMFFRAQSSETFIAAWNEIFGGDYPERAPAIAFALMQALFFTPALEDFARRFARREYKRLADLGYKELARYLVHSDALKKDREDLLQELLRSRGVEAAKAIVAECEHARSLSEALVTATKMLLEAAPKNRLATLGAVLSLRISPDYALPHIVRWVNSNEYYERFDQMLRYELGQGDRRRLLDALAADALGKDEYAHEILARAHADLVEDREILVAWIKANTSRGNRRYVAALLSELLSDERTADGSKVIEALISLARDLHKQFGHTSEHDLVKAANISTIKTRPEFPRLAAIALVKDVLHEPRPIKKDEVLRRLRTDYPYTYKALGGKNLDKHLEKGLRFPWIWFYEDGLEEMRARAEPEIRKTVAGDKKPNYLDYMRWSRATRGIAFRVAWEDRFKKMSAAKVTIEESELRNNPNYWTELIFLAALLDQFEVVVKPDNVPGLEGKRPEFLLKSPDGDLVFEVTAVSAKPDDIRDGAKSSSGLEIQDKLDKKWRKQFKAGEVNIGMPIVIAVQTEWEHDLEFDLTNSLYGAQSFSWTMDHEKNQVVAEGSKRDTKVGFFNRPEKVECISAVVGIAPPDPREQGLRGELFMPVRPPWNPLSPKLWVRLRTALFGRRPKWLVERMLEIPTISEAEVEILVDAGVDDISFFAGERYSYPDGLSITRQRFDELIAEAQRAARLHRTGRLEHLRSVNEKDLEALHGAGVFTVNQLVSLSRPAKIPEARWAAWRVEAFAFGYKPGKPYQPSSTDNDEDQKEK